MGAIDGKRLISFLSGQSAVDTLQELLIEILTLQDKLEHLEEQSFYFRKGAQANHRRLEQLKEEYTRLREVVNNNDVDFFVGRIRECEEVIGKLKAKSGLGFVDQVGLAGVQSKLQYYQVALGYKNKYGALLPLEELVRDEERLRKVFE